jgi:hypothetical protein
MLSVFMLSAFIVSDFTLRFFMLCVVLLSDFVLNVIMLSIAVCNLFAQCIDTDYHIFIVMLSVVFLCACNAECRCF